eukprot:3787279-Amphidinium_carterae.1
MDKTSAKPMSCKVVGTQRMLVVLGQIEGRTSWSLDSETGSSTQTCGFGLAANAPIFSGYTLDMILDGILGVKRLQRNCAFHIQT